LLVKSITPERLAAKNWPRRVGMGSIFAKFAKAQMMGVRVRTTISLEVKTDIPALSKKKEKNNLCPLPFDAFTVLMAKKSKMPELVVRTNDIHKK
jgi:hypothetical protein